MTATPDPVDRYLETAPEAGRTFFLATRELVLRHAPTATETLSYNMPTFVVDAYTHRILARHGVIDEDFGYEAIQEVFMDALDCDVQLFNEYHALLVRVGNGYCKKNNPDCAACPLQGR